MASLIQQRMSIDRIRVRALWIISVSGIMLVMGGALALSGSLSLFSAVSLVIWLSGVVCGIIELQRFRRELRDFEAQHGAGAGIQG